MRGGSDGAEPQASAAAARDRQESLARVEAGGVPLEAERRLQALAQSSFFTSGLSVAEFALGHELGLRPLGQVMGASIHQVGYQYLPAGWYGEQVFCELDVVTHAWDQARRRSFDRLTEEARHLGADAVVGVRLHRGAHDWAAGCVDYVVSGTAVRWASERASWPVVTDLSVQDYWKLVRGGYAPVGITAATSVFFVSPSSSTQWSRTFSAAVNQELTDYTQGFYAARETALRYLSSQADAVDASGIVGVRIEHHVRPSQQNTGGSDRGGLEITFHAEGTAIRESAGAPQHPPETTLRMGA